MPGPPDARGDAGGTSSVACRSDRMAEAKRWVRAGVAAAIILSGCAVAAAQPDPLADAAAFYGARIGMTRSEILAHAPARPCTIEPSADPKQLFITCGPHRLSADFTAAGKAWWLRASYDMSGTAATLAEARAALVARYGEPSGGADAHSLAWLPPGTPAAQVAPCLGAATLLVARIELRGSSGANAEPVPTIDPACVPLRSALLADYAGHRGVIVEMQDPRPRLAELSGTK